MQEYLKLKSEGLVCCAWQLKRDRIPWQSPRCVFLPGLQYFSLPHKVCFCPIEEVAVHPWTVVSQNDTWGIVKGDGGFLPKRPVRLLPWQSSHEPSASTILKPLCPQFSQYLHENASYVRPLEEGMLHLFESITEDTVTVLVRFPPFSIQKDFTEHKHLPVVFSFLGNNCEIEGLLRTFSFLLRLFKKDSSLSVKKVPFIW